jgi:hexosaminidase
MPWPANVSVQAGAVEIDAAFTISVSGEGARDPRIADAVSRTFARLSRQTGIPILPKVVRPGESATLSLVIEQRDHRPPQRLGDDERYSLAASNGRIQISADGPLGALRGLETFLQLVQQNTSVAGGAPASPGFSVPAVAIQDQPRFEWRGLSLDVSRHFIPVDGVKRTIDGMAAVKLNVLHWHLSDDQGFRVESKRYPRLQQLGSDGLYYTQAEVRDVVAYAGSRGVRILPEFDMPGHATSWLPGYPKLGSGPGPYEIAQNYGTKNALIDPTRESTYRFLDGFIGEMTKLFPDEFFHIGGDEVRPGEWNDNPRIQAFMRKRRLRDAKALQVYFNRRLLQILTRHHKRMVGWDEILQADLPKTIVIEAWRNKQALVQGATNGYAGILAAGYYLDLMLPASQHYAVDPLKGDTANLAPAQKEFILGGEGAMWEELATAENLDAKLWPRLAAIAERFWSPESVTDAASMYRRLETTNRWLEWLGLRQRAGLELMRERLAGSQPVEPLDVFASVLEPVKGYTRNAAHYTSTTPFNRLVDSIPPESDAAREFRDAVDRYLAMPADQRNSDRLREQLKRWADNLPNVRPMLESNSLLTENLVLADALANLCRIGEESLAYLGAGTGAPADWKQRSLAIVIEAEKSQRDTLVRIAPGIQKLVEAVQQTAGDALE